MGPGIGILSGDAERSCHPMRQLLHSEGKLLVHIGDALAAHVRALFDEVFSGSIVIQ